MSAFHASALVFTTAARHVIYFYLFIYFYFILFATLITKNIGKEEEEKKEVARRPNRNYRSL